MSTENKSSHNSINSQAWRWDGGFTGSPFAVIVLSSVEGAREEVGVGDSLKPAGGGGHNAHTQAARHRTRCPMPKRRNSRVAALAWAVR